MTFKSVPSRRTILCVCDGEARVRVLEGGLQKMLEMSLLLTLFHFEKVTLSLPMSVRLSASLSRPPSVSLLLR